MKVKLTVISLAVVAVILGGLWWRQQLLPVSPGNTSEVPIVVPKSQGAGVTLDELAAKGLIKSSIVAKIYFRLTGASTRIQSGTFFVSSGQNLPEILQTLSESPKDVWVTIPEGWRREQIAARFAAELAGPGLVFSESEFLDQTKGLEGQLFPDTYLVPREIDTASIIKILSDTFTKKTELDPVAQKNILILASLVEREGKTAEDRPVIAGILQKRLDARWPLQVDATLQYTQGNAANWWPSELNTKLPSPYNTYLHPGLPPTPIANPGLAAINAVRNPTQTTYWYYLHGPDGAIHYGATLAEHNANIDKYLNP